MAYESCTTANASSLGPHLVDICSASTFLIFMSYLDAAIRKNNVISGVCDRVKPVVAPDDEYDFIVVGGGTGGSVVASRLSENSKWKVLLLEAGPDEPLGGEIPSFATKFLGTKIDWNYTTVNESNACLSSNGSCAWPSGKNLGGNSVHSGMVYLRGNSKDFDDWAELGNEGWSWEDVKPYFLKSEDNRDIETLGTDYHATGGPLPIERFSYYPPLDESILQASIELGYGVSNDLNGDVNTGFSVTQAAMQNGVKFSTASAYLRPIRDRQNLDVSLDSYVTRVLIENQTAIGVEYYKDNELKTVCATKEVIIAAGVMRSPFILLHSGIGPTDHLESVGIPVIKDLPGVGENNHNHVSYRVGFTSNDKDIYENNEMVAEEYLTDQTGLMSCIGLASVVGMLSSDLTTPDYPDLEIFGSGSMAGCAPGEVDAVRSTAGKSVTIIATYTQPKSRGRISLASNDPFDYPVIWANYLSDENDVKALVQGINIVLELSQTEALKAHNLTLSPQQIDACSDLEFPSDEYWACAVRYNTNPSNHQAGSCKMGPMSDPLAVVDPELRVHGINGLRVADASIMPKVTSGNTAAPTIMIAEKAADLISMQCT